MPIDWVQLGIGGIIGTAVTGLVSVVGQLINRSTAIDTSKIEDRRELTKELFEQLEKTFLKVGELEGSMSLSQRRELVLMRVLINIGAELRILNGFLTVHALELKKDNVNVEELREQAGSMLEALNRMQSLLDAENEYLQTELKPKLKPNEPPKGN
jgi:hypothetical protein